MNHTPGFLCAAGGGMDRKFFFKMLLDKKENRELLMTP
jgi:hypothetical protein